MFNKGTINSFERITLILSGMRITEEYEILPKGGRAELSLYSVLYTQNENKRRLEKRVETSSSALIDILNECKIIKWDGFSGKNPRGVRDGTMFNFETIVNDGKKIHACGSNNYPKRYREFRDCLYNLLSEAL